MLRHGKKAEFSILTLNGDVLMASGSFREEGYNVGMVSYHPQLTPWIRLPVCSLAELKATMAGAALTLGGTLSVTYTALTDGLNALLPDERLKGNKTLVPIESSTPLIAGQKDAECCEGAPPEG
jgi:hypothetical protein